MTCKNRQNRTCGVYWDALIDSVRTTCYSGLVSPASAERIMQRRIKAGCRVVWIQDLGKGRVTKSYGMPA